MAPIKGLIFPALSQHSTDIWARNIFIHRKMNILATLGQVISTALLCILLLHKSYNLQMKPIVYSSQNHTVKFVVIYFIIKVVSWSWYLKSTKLMCSLKTLANITFLRINCCRHVRLMYFYLPSSIILIRSFMDKATAQGLISTKLIFVFSMQHKQSC